jgi:pyruvate dehydrogenase E2 component (dihydrolipoamide acetyltransferase)
LKNVPASGPIAVRMPKLGMTMEEGTVVEWRVAPGGRVEKGRILLVIESEKNEAEIEATASGFLRHVYVSPGEVAPCGALLAALTETADEPFDAPAYAAAEAPAKPRAAPVAATAPAPAASAPARAGERRAIAPAARALAKKLGLDAERVPGSGPGGRVTREDVEAFAARAARHERVTAPVPRSDAEASEAAARRERLVAVAPGVALEVLREGQGDPVLLLPGFGTDVSSFALLTPQLTPRFSVLAVNPRGVGASEGAGGDVPTLAADAAAVLESAAQGRPAHVVGASLGAAVAIELALTRPDRVRSLTLITPFVAASPRLLATLDAWQRLAAEVSPATLARALAPLLFSDALLADAPRRERTLRGLAASAARVPAATLACMAAGLAAWSGTREKELGRIAAPTLLLAGGADLLTPDGEAIARAIPGARCVVVPGAGHALASDAPGAVAEALLACLDEAPR